MKPISKPISVLLYEDIKVYSDSFKTKARAARIIVNDVDNVEDLMTQVSSNLRKYSFLVLDARAFLKKGQKPGSENEMNIFKIFDFMKDLNSKGFYIPYCINTGFADVKTQLNNMEVPCEIFEKGNEENLFNFIWDKHNNSDVGKLLAIFPEIFNLAQLHFDDVNFQIIKDLFANDKFKSARIVDRVANLQALRRTTEHLFDIIHQEYLNGTLIPRTSGSRLGDISKYLYDNNDIPNHLYSFLITVRKVCSEFGSHTPEVAIALPDYPSEFFFYGLAMALNDLYSWAQTKIGSVN